MHARLLVLAGLLAIATIALALALAGGRSSRLGFGMMGSGGGMGMMGLPPQGTAVTSGSAATLYRANCAVCHGADRRGLVGPPLLPSALTRDDAFYANTIANGRPGTAMPGWGQRGLTPDQIRALVTYLKSPP